MPPAAEPQSFNHWTARQVPLLRISERSCTSAGPWHGPLWGHWCPHDDPQASHPRAGGRGRDWPGSDISWLRLGVGCWPRTSLWYRSWRGLGCEIWVSCQPVGHGSGAGLVGGGTAKASSPPSLATIMSPPGMPRTL